VIFLRKEIFILFHLMSFVPLWPQHKKKKQLCFFYSEQKQMAM